SERVPEDQNIAVLPLFNLDDTQEDQAYFSRGMTNEIIDELTKIRSVRVASFSSIIRYENYATMDKSLRDIAAELGVRYLVAGSTQIYSENDSFTLSIELIEPEESLQRIWHQKYTESMRDIVRIQSGIARNIAQSLNIELSDAELRDLGTLNTVSGEATRLLYEAESEFAKLNGAGFNRAIELLKQALDLDPNYAQAHTFMAWTYNQSGLTFYQDAINRPTRQTTTLFNQHAERALELDPLSSDLYMVRANFRLNHTGRLVDARNDVDRALKINSWPRIPTKYCVCTASTIYLLLGDLARAKELVEITSRVDPGNVFIDTEKAMIHLTEGRMTQAQSSMKVALTKTPIPFLNFLTGLTFYHDHQYQEALNYFLRAYHTEGRPIPHAVAYLANTHRQLGNASDALAFQKELEDRMAEGEHHLHYIFAMMKMAAGEHDEALDLLETAQAQQESALAYFLNLDPIFKPLYQDPRFIAIRSKMQFQQ
ncbi:MAG: hypothetical protein R3301_19265, partial [Saprospiraceae bacterium]|nr:hypothetical protein [Saprospiraceae bacterium]